jgi:uncharacterized protein (TIGR03435 family)
MKRGIIVLILASGFVLRSQPAGDAPAFEAASVKVSPPTPNGYSAWLRGGPNSPTPAKIDYHNASMTMLVAKAYGVPTYLITGPDWLNTEKYEIAARLAPDTTPAQFQAMLRALLAERFKLVARRDRREFPVYALTVLKSGSKVKEHVEKIADEPKPPGNSTLDEDGYPIVHGSGLSFANGRIRLQMSNVPLSDLVNVLSSQVNAAVHDHTGLEGKYDYRLQWGVPTPDKVAEPENVPDVFAALEMHLGLKLEKTKEPTDIVVVDRAEKVPAGN